MYILEELKPMEDTMKHLYNKMVLMHEVVVPLVRIQKKYQEILKVLNVTSTTVDSMQYWGIKYLNIPEWSVTKDKIAVEVDRA